MTGPNPVFQSSDAMVDALMRVTGALSAITARSLSSVNEDVTLAQFRTLVALSESGPLTVTTLAERLDVHASTMTRMCTRLVTRGLVARVPSSVDRREVVIALSSTGSALVDDVMASRRMQFDLIVRKLSEAEQTAAIAALEVFAAAVGDGPASGINDVRTTNNI